MRGWRTALALGAVMLVTACSSGSSKAKQSTSAPTDHPASKQPASTTTKGLPGQSYKHGFEQVTVGGFQKPERTPPPGKAWFDITGLSLSAGAKAVEFSFLVGCAGNVAGALIPDKEHLISADGKHATVAALSGAGATDTVAQVPAGCQAPTLTITTDTLGSITYDVPMAALTVS